MELTNSRTIASGTGRARVVSARMDPRYRSCLHCVVSRVRESIGSNVQLAVVWHGPCHVGRVPVHGMVLYRAIRAALVELLRETAGLTGVRMRVLAGRPEVEIIMSPAPPTPGAVRTVVVPRYVPELLARGFVETWLITVGRLSPRRLA